MNPVELARQELHKRQNRTSHPEGTFNKKGKWVPSAAERRACCMGIRSHSKYTLMFHCRTPEHVAHLFNVAESNIRAGVTYA